MPQERMSAAISRAMGLGGLVLLAVGCEGRVAGPGPTAPPLFPVPDAALVDGATVPATGQAIFSAACAPCHGVRGEGTVLGYEVQHPVRPFATWVMRNGRPGPGFVSPMAAYPPALVDDQQASEIWDYLAAFPQPTTGRDLYQDYCANCHGADARGGSVGKDISDKAGPDALEKVRAGVGGTNYSARNKYMPGWTAAELSDQEVDLIVQHIATLP